MLIHDPALRGLLDDWVAGLGDDDFVEVLPLVRRTFGSFSPSERRSIAGKLAGGPTSANRASDPGQSAVEELEQELDLELAAPALATVALILGRAGAAPAELP